MAAPAAGVELTFRRKPNSEKGGQDGGLRFALSGAGADGGAGGLLVSRISEGQYTAKIFSERKIIRRIVSDLDKLPASCGTVTAVLDFSSLQDGPS